MPQKKNQSESDPSFYKFMLVMTIGTLVKLAIGLSPFSGFDNSNPPNGEAAWGDFECHRTWMTVTNKLPVKDWYSNSSLSNTSYWPMDYPPLCMEVHYVMGLSVQAMEPFALEIQGYMEPHYKWLMRGWVILLELIIFVPAAWYFLRVTTGKV